MKLLRILTGVHAGASLRLSQAPTTLGAEADCEVLISDWTHRSVSLSLDESNRCLVTVASDPDAAEAPAVVSLPDWQPQRYGDVVVCAGPGDEPWPSDIALLQRLLEAPAADETVADAGQPTAPVAEARRPSLATYGLMAVALLGSFAGVLAFATNKKEAPEPLEVRVKQAVLAAGGAGLTVRSLDGKLTVQGLVEDSVQAGRVHQALEPFAANGVEERFAAGSDVARSIAESLAMPGIEVRHRGGGEFEIAGKAPDLEKLRTAVTRVAADLAPLVRHVSITADETPSATTAPIGSMMASSDLQYVQTRDGIKHLSISNAETAPAAASAPASAPAQP